ncbi:hypothetical protein ACOSQ4_017595 [Xanthoceras sorbifolium]
MSTVVFFFSRANSIGELLSRGLPGSMKILVWNVRGLGNYRTFQALNRHVRDSRPDVVFLTETLLSRQRLEFIRVHLGFSGDPFTWCNDRRGASFIKERLDRFVGNLN